MVGNIITSYPVFESGQLLTSAQLNDTRSFLDENLRVNRTLLNGVGVVSGLEVLFDPTGNAGLPQIKITKGIGITTDGYLVSLPSDITYTKFDNYVEVQGDPFFPTYAPWYDINGSQFVLQELFTSTGAGANMDTLALLQEHVVLVFLKEVIDEQSTFCVSTDTDSSGSIKRFELKTLLMHEDDFNTLAAYNNEALTARNNPLDTLRIKRLTKVAGLLNTFTDDTFIKNNYTTLVDEYKVLVGDYLKAAYNQYSAFLGLNFNESAQNFTAFINANLNANTTLASDNIEYIQYVYAYLNDLIEAADEFSEAAYRSFKDSSPVNPFSPVADPTFPRHLALGRVAQQDSMPGLVYKQNYRYYFTQVFYSEGKEEQILKAQLLFERLVLMVKTFSIPTTSTSIPVLITPSRKENEALSLQAMPFYYSLTDVNVGSRLYTIWNPEAYIRNQSKKTVTNALVQDANTSSTNPGIAGLANHIKEPLAYSFNANDFYRIEGHIGLTITQALSDLIALRKDNNIDFGILSLKLTTDNPLPVDENVTNHDISLFHHFTDIHHGLEHRGGVTEGGTFVLVHFDNIVVADFCLPDQTPYTSILY